VTAPTTTPDATNASAQLAFTRFDRSADGFIAPLPDHPQILGDMRYSLAANGFEPFWSVDFESTPPAWHSLSDAYARPYRALWRDILGLGREDAGADAAFGVDLGIMFALLIGSCRLPIVRRLIGLGHAKLAQDHGGKREK